MTVGGAVVDAQDRLSSKSQNKPGKPLEPAGSEKVSRAGEVRCWKDAQGNIIYSNAIPSGKDVKPCR